MIKCFKLRNILIPIAIFIFCCLISLGIVAVNELTDSPFRPYTIVLDAGHGGRDNGCIGINGTKESDINLQITKIMASMLQDFGFRVILTRTNENGLYDNNATNYKVSDMKKRINIITKARPDFVISIHQNSFKNIHQQGAQAFWQDNNKEGEMLANSIQESLVSQLPNARKEANYGDYYILKESPASAVIVECGYLSNPEEELLLTTQTYQEKISYAIVCGIVKYFDVQ